MPTARTDNHTLDNLIEVLAILRECVVSDTTIGKAASTGPVKHPADGRLQNIYDPNLLTADQRIRLANLYATLPVSENLDSNKYFSVGFMIDTPNNRSKLGSGSSTPSTPPRPWGDAYRPITPDETPTHAWCANELWQKDADYDWRAIDSRICRSWNSIVSRGVVFLVRTTGTL